MSLKLGGWGRSSRFVFGDVGRDLNEWAFTGLKAYGIGGYLI
jgi:hypothetical protein